MCIGKRLRTAYSGRMAETQTTIYMDEGLKRLLDENVRLFGTQKNVINAAIWLFTEADDVGKLKAIRAAAELTPNGEKATGMSSSASAASGGQKQSRQRKPPTDQKEAG